MMSHSLDIQADMLLQNGDHVCHLKANGNSIALQASSLSALQSLRPLKKSRAGQGKLLHSLHKYLCKAGLELHVRINERPVARLGANARSGLLAKILGLGPTELYLGNLIRAILGW